MQKFKISMKLFLSLVDDIRSVIVTFLVIKAESMKKRMRLGTVGII